MLCAEKPCEKQTGFVAAVRLSTPEISFLLDNTGILVSFESQALSYSNDFVLLLVTLMQEAFQLPLQADSDKGERHTL